MSPPRSRRDSRQEAEPRRSKSRQEFSPSSRWDSGREAKSRRPKSRRDPGGNPAKIPPGFKAGNGKPAAKIAARPGGNLGGIPPGFTAGNGNPGGQNLGRTRRESRWDPAKIPPRSRWLFYKGLIETSEKVKESIDTQQNKLIEQIQKNQLALTEGLDKNRLAITSGFDKMDEVNKWDLRQLPGFEAIEKPEIEEEEEIEPVFYWITKNDLKLLEGEDESKLTKDGEELIEIEENFLYELLSKDKLNQDKYKFKKNTSNPGYTIFEIVEREQGKKQGVVLFDDTDLDEGLLNKRSVEVLKNLKLPLPSELKNEKLEDILFYQKNAEVQLNYFADLLSPNKANLYKEEGVSKAIKKNKDPNRDTRKQIKIYNILGQYINNIGNLVKYAKKSGQGIIHFNNPQQLVKRLELLAGSIIAGNNGVKQEFSQIAYLLHQLKVITKKTLNDLLKNIILFK